MVAHHTFSIGSLHPKDEEIGRVHVSLSLPASPVHLNLHPHEFASVSVGLVNTMFILFRFEFAHAAHKFACS